MFLIYSGGRSQDQCPAPSQKGHSACGCPPYSDGEYSFRIPIPSHSFYLTEYEKAASPGLKSESPSNVDSSGKTKPDVYVAEGDYIKDIEINDLRNRYTLTKGSTQKMVIIPVPR